MGTIQKDKRIRLFKAEDRGFANHGWLQAAHSFSFANYYDPEKMHFGVLRVLNDDIIAPGMGFGTHPHNNMEIITIPLSGILKHRDSMHNAWQTVEPGEVQVMSAGTGVQHSEINGSKSEHLSLFQIWIMPDKKNVTPRYDQRKFEKSERKDRLQVLVTSFDDTISEGLKIHQDARLSRIDLSIGKDFEYKLKSSNHGLYLMNIYGELKVEDEHLGPRDAIGISNIETVNIQAIEDSAILFIEVPMN